MKRSFCEDSFTSQQWLGNPTGNRHRPFVVFVTPIGEGNEKTCIRNGFHERENPFRVERFFAPRTLPARRMKLWAPLLDFAFSNWSRTSFPCDMPLFAAAVSNQAANSLFSRIVIV